MLNKDKGLVTHDDVFERAARDSKTKADFNRVVDVFNKKDIRRRGHVEFIYAALKKMPEFGSRTRHMVYNQLLDVFSKRGVRATELHSEDVQPLSTAARVWSTAAGADGETMVCVCLRYRSRERKTDASLYMICQFFVFLIFPGIMRM